MSLEFGIEFSCAVRRRISEEKLRELARLASVNSRFITLSINSQHPPTQDMIRFVERSTAKLTQLDEILPHCRQCPANLANNLPEYHGELIGCLGRINYPIEATFEHFLANRIQLILDVLPAADWPRILHILIDRESPFDGEVTKDLRRVTTADGLRFFELRNAIKLHRQASHLCTDNIFDLLGGFATTDNGASSYCRELPVMALADYTELFDTLFHQDLSKQEKDDLIRYSNSFRQYLRYAEAVRRADELQVRLLID
ncbi:MAG: hypothetical protein AB1489_16935 [Acidobacteriota bacterium]